MKRSYLAFSLVLCYFMVTTIGVAFAAPSVENNTKNFKIVDWGNNWVELEYDRWDPNEVGLTIDYGLGQTPDPDPDQDPSDPSNPDPTDPDQDPPDPSNPVPTDPDLSDPDPDPTDPEPDPADPDPVDPDPSDPAPTDPEPDPADPDPVDPDPSDPAPTDPDPEIPRFIDPPDPESGPSYFILEDPHGVALGRYTKITTEDGQSFYIDENGIRIGGPRLPQTGDATPIARWYMMVILSLLSAFWIFKKERNGDLKNC